MRKPEPIQPNETDRTEYVLPDDSAGFKLAEAVAWFLLEKKAEDVVVLDLRGFSDVCDFFVLVSGRSDTQVKALGRHLHRRQEEAGHGPSHIEGQSEGRWVVQDYFDVVVHIFQSETRHYYQLERLWDDARRLELNPDWFRAPEVALRHPELDFTFAPGAETQGS